MTDFFISYTQADLSWAKWIDQELRRAGYSTIIQVWDFRAGQSFIRNMDEASAGCGYTIAVLSPDYLESRFCLMEMDAALVQGNLLPVRVQPFEVRGLASPLAYIDLARENIREEEARYALLDGVQGTSIRSSGPTPFPGSPPLPETPPVRFPGYPPPIWNVPHRRNPNFTGREELLDSLRRAVTGGAGAALTQTFAGLGGVGKTQMAAEYAYRFAPEYDLVWWLRSEDGTTLAADYAKLATDLNLPEKDVPQQEAAVAAVREKLRQMGKWLLIFDNANEPNDIKAYLPQGGGGHVIITSRNTAWGGLGKVVKVPYWQRGESVEFLLKRIGREQEPNEEEKTAAAALAEELGGLPLALGQAGAYIEECGCAIGQYLELFRARRQELMQLGTLSQEYPDTVATTWDISFQKAQEECPAAADLLNLCAFLAPNDIPRELLEKGTKHLPEGLARTVQDPLALNQALAALRRYSLMEVAPDSLSMHRLVQAVVRDRFNQTELEQWARTAAEVVNLVFPDDMDENIETWPWCSRLLPHTLAAVSQLKALNIILPVMGRLWNEVGFYLKIRAEFVRAMNAFEQALSIYEELFGPNHTEVATVADNLGMVLQAIGDLQGARTQHERALTIDEAAYGPNHTTVAIRLNNLGNVLHVLGDQRGSIALYERALAIDKMALGPNHPNVLKNDG